MRTGAVILTIGRQIRPSPRLSRLQPLGQPLDRDAVAHHEGGGESSQPRFMGLTCSMAACRKPAPDFLQVTATSVGLARSEDQPLGFDGSQANYNVRMGRGRIGAAEQKDFSPGWPQANVRHEPAQHQRRYAVSSLMHSLAPARYHWFRPNPKSLSALRSLCSLLGGSPFTFSKMR